MGLGVAGVLSHLVLFVLVGFVWVGFLVLEGRFFWWVLEALRRIL